MVGGGGPLGGGGGGLGRTGCPLPPPPVRNNSYHSKTGNPSKTKESEKVVSSVNGTRPKPLVGERSHKMKQWNARASFMKGPETSKNRQNTAAHLSICMMMNYLRR